MPAAKLVPADTLKIKAFLKAVDPKIRGGVADLSLRAFGRRTEALSKEHYIVRGRGLTSPPLRTMLSFRTGRLTRSISTDERRAPERVVTGSTVAYSRVHEQGLFGYPKRQFLKPAAIEVMRREANQIIQRYIRRLTP